MPKYTEKIEKISIPFRIRHMRHEVPANAVIVHVAHDIDQPECAAIWYKYTTLLDDGFGEMPMKIWLLGVVRTGEEFIAGAAHLGTALQHNEAWHVLDLAPIRG